MADGNGGEVPIKESMDHNFSSISNIRGIEAASSDFLEGIDAERLLGGED